MKKMTMFTILFSVALLTSLVRSVRAAATMADNENIVASCDSTDSQVLSGELNDDTVQGVKEIQDVSLLNLNEQEFCDDLARIQLMIQEHKIHLSEHDAALIYAYLRNKESRRLEKTIKRAGFIISGTLLVALVVYLIYDYKKTCKIGEGIKQSVDVLEQRIRQDGPQLMDYIEQRFLA